MALGALTLPSVSTGFLKDSKALVPVSIQGVADKVNKESPLATMLLYFLDIRDGIVNLGEIFSEKISGLNSHLAFRLETLNKTMSNIGSIAADDLDIEKETFKEFKENEARDERAESLGTGEKEEKGPGMLAGLKGAFGDLMDKLTPESEGMKVGLMGLLTLGLFTQLDKIKNAIEKVYIWLDETIIPAAERFWTALKDDFGPVWDGIFGEGGWFSLLFGGVSDIFEGF